MSEALNDLSAYLGEKLGSRLDSAVVAYGELTLTVAASDIVEVLNFLKTDVQCQFISFIDICGVDYPSREKRFAVALTVAALIAPGSAGASPASIASRCARMTFSGR